MPSPERRLLVLDDDERIARFVASVAQQQGWTVDLAENSETFHARLRAHRPDAIMLDLRLGATDGVEQLRFLHTEAYRGTVVLMSGLDSRVLAAARQVGSALGISIAATLEKPARLARLRAVLHDLEIATTAADGFAEPRAPSPLFAPDGAPNGTSNGAVEPITPALIARALSAGQMELFLQPIVAARDRRTLHAEALIRWHRPELGIVPPDRFIAVAERDRTVIDQLTMWAIEAGTDLHRRLGALGLAMPIWINVSGENLHSADFPDRVAAVLQRSGLPHGAIGLEITESVALRDVRASAAILMRLRRMGFALAVDDFGTGHATPAVLRQLPFSVLKIDRVFVTDLPHSAHALAIVRSMIDLAGTLGMTTVAEGIENEAVAQALVGLNVAALQGYHFSPPLPFDRFVAWQRARTMQPA
jgi:EAL domain-containing protein (putative c-di-GMP-specific phosphodiesterase class I)/CheY-like chemotaxis protein